MMRAWRLSLCLSVGTVLLAAGASDCGGDDVTPCDSAVDELERCGIDETYICNDGCGGDCLFDWLSVAFVLATTCADGNAGEESCERALDDLAECDLTVRECQYDCVSGCVRNASCDAMTRADPSGFYFFSRCMKGCVGVGTPVGTPTGT